MAVGLFLKICRHHFTVSRSKSASCICNRYSKYMVA
jgi:hypothetical protein